MFESYRGMEYGWTPDQDNTGTSFEQALDRSFVGSIMHSLLRADIDPYCRRDAIATLNDTNPGWAFGTPGQYAILNMQGWLEMNLEYLQKVSERHPLGAEIGVDLDSKGERKITADDWRKIMWRPPSDYNTKVSCVTEHRVNIEETTWMLNMIREEGKVEFDEASTALKDKIRSILNRVERSKGIFTVMAWGWLPRSQNPEDLEARNYMDDCERYQASIAGRRAKRLLLENLTPDQERDYFKQGYFFVIPRNQEDKPLHKRNIYVIERGFPNGNVMRVRQKRTLSRRHLKWFPEATYCFHTKEPHAVDDILLSQKLVLEHDEEDFLKSANITSPPLRGLMALDMVKRSV